MSRRCSEGRTLLRKRRAGRRGIQARLLCVLVGLGIALTVAEIVLRGDDLDLARPRLPLTYDHRAIDRLADGTTYLKFDRDLGWITTPDIDLTDDGVHYRHDQDGRRTDQQYPARPSPGGWRLAAYGDSFTYCSGEQLEDCWTRQLERLLPNTDVLNYGVPGYGPDQAWLRYQHRPAANVAGAPCAVLVGHMVENIQRVVNRFRPFYEPDTGIPLAKPRFVLDDGRLVLLPQPVQQPSQLHDASWVEAQLGPHDFWYVPGTFVPHPLDRLELVRLLRTAWYRQAHGPEGWTIDHAARMYRPDTEPFQVLLAILTQFAAEVQAAGATPVVVVFPTADEIAAQRDGLPKPHAPLLDALAHHNIATLDLTDALGEAARHADLRSIVGSHYRPAGNAVVAQTLATQLPALVAGTCGELHPAESAPANSGT